MRVLQFPQCTSLSIPYKYNLDLAINATSVVVMPARQICNISDIDEERECTVDLEFKIGKVCFVAYTEYEGDILHFEVANRAPIEGFADKRTSNCTVSAYTIRWPSFVYCQILLSQAKQPVRTSQCSSLSMI